MKTPLTLARGEPRQVRRRTHTFRPNYLSFAGTYQCNLHCPHCCVPIEWPDRLDIGVAVRFLEDAHAHGIRILGFTGGEPFVYPEFLVTLCRRGAELGMRFDKIMTNGVWYRDAEHLNSTLSELAATGFSGKLGLSIDKFHFEDAKSIPPQPPLVKGGSEIPPPLVKGGSEISPPLVKRGNEISPPLSKGGPGGVSRLAYFCRTARRIFDRDTIISLSYASRTPEVGLEPIHRLAKELDGVVEWSDLLGRRLLVSQDLTMTLNWNHLAPVERAERFTGAWDGEWFEEDYCEGPGQALIITPKGEVKPCCGFASDLDQLTIGNIHTDTVADVIRQGREHPYVGKVFREGLTAIRDEILARDPNALPEATSNHCFFCWYVLSKAIYPLPFNVAKNPRTGLQGLPMVDQPWTPPA